MPVFRLAVLEADIPSPAVVDLRGTYTDIFRDLFNQGLALLGPKADGWQLEVSKWDVVDAQNYPALDEVDGFLITGSKQNAYDNDEWILKLVDFTSNALNTSQKPVVGSCFGHQIVGRSLGAEVGVNPRGPELSVRKVDLNEAGQALFGVPALELHQLHFDIIFQAPSGVQSLGSSPLCDTQVFYQPGRILTVQGHPEFDSFITGSILKLDRISARLGQDVINEALDRVDRPHGGILVASKMVELLLASKQASL